MKYAIRRPGTEEYLALNAGKGFWADRERAHWFDEKEKAQNYLKHNFRARFGPECDAEIIEDSEVQDAPSDLTDEEAEQKELPNANYCVWKW